MTRNGLHTLALWLPACACVAQAPVLRAQVLPNTLTVTSATAPLHQANQTITTSGTVTLPNGASTTFEAGTTVDLKPGFHASVGSKFAALIAYRRHAGEVAGQDRGTDVAYDQAGAGEPRAPRAGFQINSGAWLRSYDYCCAR